MNSISLVKIFSSHIFNLLLSWRKRVILSTIKKKFLGRIKIVTVSLLWQIANRSQNQFLLLPWHTARLPGLANRVRAAKAFRKQMCWPLHSFFCWLDTVNKVSRNRKGGMGEEAKEREGVSFPPNFLPIKNTGSPAWHSERWDGSKEGGEGGSSGRI